MDVFWWLIGNFKFSWWSIYILYFAEFISKLSNKTVFLKNITIFRGVHLATCMPSCGDHFARMANTCIRIPRPLKSWDYFLAGKIVLMHWWSIWYVYQIPSLRKIVEYLLPRNHTERSNSLERRKYAKLCASHTHAQIKNFCLMSHFQVTWIIKEIFIWGHTFFPLLLTAYKWSITCRDNSTTKTTSSIMI